MERTAMADLVRWKDDPKRKPMLVYGARQVGKSYLIQEFAKANFDNYVILDLEAHKNLHVAFEDDLSPKSILSKLEHISGLPLQLENALIVFDEIQTCDGALTSLKYFQEQAPPVSCHRGGEPARCRSTEAKAIHAGGQSRRAHPPSHELRGVCNRYRLRGYARRH